MSIAAADASRNALCSLLETLMSRWSLDQHAREPRLKELERVIREILADSSTPPQQCVELLSIYDPMVKWRTEKAACPRSDVMRLCEAKSCRSIPDEAISRILVDHFLKDGSNICWFHNKSKEWCDMNQGRSDTSCVLVGSFKEATIQHHDLALGFMYLEPGTTYPAHAHSGIEVYYIVAGRCLMSKARGAFQWQVAGDVVIHEAHEVHAAICDSDEGVLILWSKWNDTDQVYYFVQHDRESDVSSKL